MAQLIRRNGFLYKSLFSFIKRTAHYSTIANNNPNSSSKVFSLFAPTIEEATLISSFSKWQPIPMKKDPKTGTFETASSLNIPDGEHGYKFRIRKSSDQDWLAVNDPYIEKYDPKNKCGLITIQNGKKYLEPYEWKYDHFKLPENDQLIVYELYVADFTENGQFSGIIPKLDYLADLGINAIEFLPIQEFMGDEHDWGYTPIHHFALKTNYGSINDFKKLVDECHKRGIRVVFDGIFNHSSPLCPIAQIDRSYWFYKDQKRPGDPHWWGPEFNYHYEDKNLKIRPAVKYAQDIIQYWVGQFHLDGVRFDAARQLENNYLLSELDQLGRSIRYPQPFYTQAEHVPERADIVKANKGPVDACWSSTFHGIIAKTLINKTEFEIDVVKYVISAPHLVNYLTCHDNERLMYLINRDAKVFDADAFQRVRLGAIVLMTSVSIPMIWQGDEFGEARELGTVDHYRKKFLMQWDLLNKEYNKGLFNVFKNLIRFRKTILNENKYNQLRFFYENLDHRILAYSRSNDTNNEDIVIITNFNDQIQSNYEITNFPQNGQWVDWFTNETYSVDNSILNIDLKPFDGKILLRQN